MKINVLGTEYSTAVKRSDEDEYFKQMGCSGYCSGSGGWQAAFRARLNPYRKLREI